MKIKFLSEQADGQFDRDVVAETRIDVDTLRSISRLGDSRKSFSYLLFGKEMLH